MYLRLGVERLPNQFFTVVFKLSKEDPRSQEEFADCLEKAIEGWTQLSIIAVREE